MMMSDMKAAWILGILFIALIFLVLKRMQYGSSFPGESAEGRSGEWAVSQTTGNQEIQADFVDVYKNHAGIMGVLADGIGKENTGKLCAQMAADALLDGFEPYHTVSNPPYLFRTAFLEANSRIQKTIGNRRGGACLGAVYTDGAMLHYGLAGNIRIALFRRDELIPLSKGQTMDVLAVNAYEEGRLTKKETIWSLEETRIWNYLGKDGFREIELCEQPVRLKAGDVIFLASCGIFEELSWAEIEDVLTREMTLQEKADCLVMAADQKPGQDKDNGSVLLLKAEVLNEKDQF